jgi:hypothetical protein
MEYTLMNILGEVQTVTLTEEHENNTIYKIRIGDYNYTLEDINDPVGLVLDANNQPVYLIDWQNQMIRSTEGMNLEPEWDNDDDYEDEPSWDDEPAPVPGHYGPGPEPENLPNPVTLFQEDEEYVGPSLDEQLTDYNPATDIGHAVFYGEVYEIREVSTTPFIYDLLGELVGCITNDAPYFY